MTRSLQEVEAEAVLDTLIVIGGPGVAALERDAHLSVHVSRIVRAAKYSVARHPRLAQASLRFDVIFLAPRQWPRHVMNAFSDNAD